MSQQTKALPARLQKTNAILLTTDILRSVRVAEQLKQNDESFIAFLDDYYHLCSKMIKGHGGDLIKYMGDATLSIFPSDDPVAPIDAIQQIRADFPSICDAFRISRTDIKAALHIGDVVVGELGPEGYRDVLGSAVNTLFQIEGKGNVTISETLYRKLPSDQRTPWRKQSAPTVYVHE